ncbi:MAG: hypothetical protein AB3N18_00465 [Allomuricauda sp.]
MKIFNTSIQRKFFAVVLGIVILACQKDEFEVELSPEISWEVLSIENNVLNIAVTISDEDNKLPEGIVGFAINGEQVQTFPLQQGTQEQSPYTFVNDLEQSAELFYSYSEGAKTIEDIKKIQRKKSAETTISQTSEWTDIN